MIDYVKLARAIEHYEEAGYQRVEVPWWVTLDIANITKPVNASLDNLYLLSLNQKCLVASGEQSFLYLANKGQLPAGKYQAVTPCFRNEPYDQYHSKHFMKLELINLSYELTWAQADIDDLAATALQFYQSLAPKAMIKLVETDSSNDPIAVKGTTSFDIVMELDLPNDLKRIELGSYGARQTSFASWIYGTGLAEPRFSKALKELLFTR